LVKGKTGSGHVLFNTAASIVLGGGVEGTVAGKVVAWSGIASTLSAVTGFGIVGVVLSNGRKCGLLAARTVGEVCGLSCGGSGETWTITSSGVVIHGLNGVVGKSGWTVEKLSGSIPCAVGG
jgi:hypothetical protein